MYKIVIYFRLYWILFYCTYKFIFCIIVYILVCISIFYYYFLLKSIIYLYISVLILHVQILGMPILFACIYLHALLYHIFQYNYYVFCVCPLFVIVVIRTYLCTYLYVYVYMSYVEFSTKTLHKNNIFLTKTKYDSEKFLYLRNNRNCRRVKVRLCSNIFCVFDKTLL